MASVVGDQLRVGKSSRSLIAVRHVRGKREARVGWVGETGPAVRSDTGDRHIVAMPDRLVRDGTANRRCLLVDLVAADGAGHNHVTDRIADRVRPGGGI